MPKTRLILRFVLGAAIGYLIFCGVVVFRQEWFFFHPSDERASLERAQKNGYKGKEVEYPASDGTMLYAWYSKPQNGKKIIVFMHGNSYNIEKFYKKMQPLQQAGYGTFIAEYRGFGGIKGRITEQNLVTDAKSAVNYLYQEGYKNRDIVIYGFSMGTHMATRVAAEMGDKEAFGGLILEAPFNDLVEVAKDHVWVPLPLELIMRDKYDSKAKIAEVKAPLLVMSGSDDEVIEPNLGKDLYERAQTQKEFISYPGAMHSNLYDFGNYKDILTWLGQHEKDK